ncbi:MAG TPA: response regulator [Candidatus Omnitrophota bacterium]|nr:response regulator [Candidatus Omnitrophota bacterium]
MKKKVLIVDDAPEIVEILEDLIESAGYQAFSSPDAEKALEMIPHNRPDLILLDLLLPRMSGAEFARKMKVDESTKTIPIIIVSVLKKDDRKNEGLEKVSDDYIEKPFEPKDLLNHVKRFLA